MNNSNCELSDIYNSHILTNSISEEVTYLILWKIRSGYRGWLWNKVLSSAVRSWGVEWRGGSAWREFVEVPYVVVMFGLAATNRCATQGALPDAIVDVVSSTPLRPAAWGTIRHWRYVLPRGVKPDVPKLNSMTSVVELRIVTLHCRGVWLRDIAFASNHRGTELTLGARTHNKRLQCIMLRRSK